LVYAPSKYTDSAYQGYETRIEAVDSIQLSGKNYILTLGYTNSIELTNAADKAGRLFVTESV
jgi:hypothetical protein